MLCQSLNAEFASKGIHVVHIVIDGAVDAPDTLGKMLGPERFQQLRETRGNEHDGLMLPTQIAETYVHLAKATPIDVDARDRPPGVLRSPMVESLRKSSDAHDSIRRTRHRSRPYETLPSSSGAAPASARAAPGCSPRAACVSASQRGTRTKPVLQELEKTHGVRRYACDASEPAAVELLFQNVVRDLGAPTLVVHNIDGRMPASFGRGSPKPTRPWRSRHFGTRRSARSWWVSRQRRLMRENEPDANGAKGTIIFTNASAALKGFPLSGAFAMACQAKAGLAQSMARELMPQGIHVANVPIDAAIGWTQEDGTRAHRLAGTTRRRQHGRPGPHRRNVSAAASPASLDLGVRSRAATVGREVVTGA